MEEFERVPDFSRAEFASYAGRWVALIGEQVVGQGSTPEQALQTARVARFKEKPQVYYVSPNHSFYISPILHEVLAALPDNQQIFLVGGAVRDMLLSRTGHDYDFALPGDVLRIAKSVANKIGAAYFPLDKERQTARLIFDRQGESRLILDFAALRGHSLESDLSGRDFTINAIAVDLRSPDKLSDPLGGAADLQAGRLRACSTSSIENDPVRILRAIRFAAEFDLRIVPETLQLLHAGVSSLETISPERIRDELFNILNVKRVATSMRALDMLGALEIVLPELSALKNLQQSAPHTKDAWNHTLDTLAQLETLLTILGPQHDADSSSSLVMGLAVMRLGRYRQQFAEFLSSSLIIERNMRPLLYLAALYHDVGKPDSKQQESDTGRIRFIEHERIGAEIVANRARALALSNAEIAWLEAVVRHHMRPTWLSREDGQPSRRAVYRFFRDMAGYGCQPGVGICLVSLADLLATYASTLPQERWARQLETVRALLEAWWENRPKQVSPPSLITGNDLIEIFKLQPGKNIGEILEAIREAQAVGDVENRAGALDFVNILIRNGKANCH